MAYPRPAFGMLYWPMQAAHDTRDTRYLLPDVEWRRGPVAYAEMAAFLTAAHPDQPVTAEDLQRLDAARLPDEPFEQVSARRGGTLMGVAEVSFPRMDSHPGWIGLSVRTLPGLAAGPLPDLLLQRAEATARDFGAATLVTRVQEDWWEKAFLEARGYTEHDRMWMSTLDLTTLNFNRFEPQEAAARATGVTIRPLSELGPFDEALQHRLYTLIVALLTDVPSTTPVSPWPFEVWQHRYARGLTHPEGLFIAIAPNGDWVGLSELRVPIAARPGTLQNGLTGVLPPWRGTGLAYALKLAAARAGLERGFTHARTGNHSINRPMLAINERLGFVREGSTVTLVKACSL